MSEQNEFLERQKILILGGVESVKYSVIAMELGIKAESYSHFKRFRTSRISSYKAIVCLTRQLSHSMVKQIRGIAAKKGIPIYYLTKSSKSGFECFLQDYCGENCVLKKDVIFRNEDRNHLREKRRIQN